MQLAKEAGVEQQNLSRLSAYLNGSKGIINSAAYEYAVNKIKNYVLSTNRNQQPDSKSGGSAHVATTTDADNKPGRDGGSRNEAVRLGTTGGNESGGRDNSRPEMDSNDGDGRNDDGDGGGRGLGGSANDTKNGNGGNNTPKQPKSGGSSNEPRTPKQHSGGRRHTNSGGDVSRSTGRAISTAGLRSPDEEIADLLVEFENTLNELSTLYKKKEYIPKKHKDNKYYTMYDTASGVSEPNGENATS